LIFCSSSRSNNTENPVFFNGQKEEIVVWCDDVVLVK
jgi:hypothetical protein